MQTKRRKAVSKRKKKIRRKGLTIRAMAEEPRRSFRTIEDVLGLYKPRKRLVTLRLDADVVEWFKRDGPGYQTRINRSLREVMRHEMKR